jgi:hypothetical protein
MSRPRYYWYYHVKKTIEHYPHGLDRSTSRGEEDFRAVEKTIDNRKMTDGEERLKLVKMLCWDRYYTMEAIALKLHISTITAHRWWRNFVYDVAREMGYYK